MTTNDFQAIYSFFYQAIILIKLSIIFGQMTNSSVWLFCELPMICSFIRQRLSTIFSVCVALDPLNSFANSHFPISLSPFHRHYGHNIVSGCCCFFLGFSLTILFQGKHFSCTKMKTVSVLFLSIWINIGHFVELNRGIVVIISFSF